MSTASRRSSAKRQDRCPAVTQSRRRSPMNGLKLAAVAKAQRPEINFIIVTGYNAPKKDEIPPGSLFIPKPYDARKMMEAIRHFQRAA
jgi:DNA-binding NtrC family response regulator